MSNKTRLELELEQSEYKNRNYGAIFLVLLVFLLLSAAGYFYYINYLELSETKKKLLSVASKCESLEIERDNLLKELSKMREKVLPHDRKEAKAPAEKTKTE